MNFLNKRNNVIGILMISFGLLFVLKKFFGINIDISWENIWPFLLILWGLVVMMKK